MTEIWRTSDEHYGDPSVARHRGFGPSTKAEWAAASPADVARSQAEHDEMVIERIAKVATKRSQVILHGDEVRSVTALRELVGILAKLPGEFGLLLGNHSPAHPIFGSRGLAAQKLYRDAFAWVATSAQHRFAGIEFLSSHFPYEGDHQAEDRYTQFRLPDLGRPIVCGHVHGAWKMKRTETGTPQYNVGVEQYPDRPVNMEELAAMMRRDLELTTV